MENYHEVHEIPDPEEPIYPHEVINLFHDLTVETYYGVNLQMVMMQADNEILRAVKKLVEMAKEKREGK